ncbi:MAG: hypothetical protein P4L51_20195 [Puia sp.]|nr:hypothetical protein [Puia sp.]
MSLPGVYIKNAAIRIHDKYQLENAPFKFDENNPSAGVFARRVLYTGIITTGTT